MRFNATATEYGFVHVINTDTVLSTGRPRPPRWPPHDPEIGSG